MRAPVISRFVPVLLVKMMVGAVRYAMVPDAVTERDPVSMTVAVAYVARRFVISPF